MALFKMVGGQRVQMSPVEEAAFEAGRVYAPTVQEAKQRKRQEGLSLARSLYSSVDPIEGDLAAYLVTLKAKWSAMKIEIQALATIDEIRDYPLDFPAVP